MFKIVRSVLSNPESRSAGIEFLKIILSQNEDRTKMYRNRNERKFLGDGAMLNYLSLLQWFSQRVILDKIDKRYPFSSSSIFVMTKESCIRGTSDEMAAWLATRGKLMFHNTHELIGPFSRFRYR